jgi:hypothetical protein
MAARSDASKKGPQLWEKSWGQVQQRLHRIDLYFRSKRRTNAALWGVLTLLRQHGLHHHNGDFQRACFIPTFFVRSHGLRRIYRGDPQIYFQSMPIYSIGKRSDRPHDGLIEGSLQE